LYGYESKKLNSIRILRFIFLSKLRSLLLSSNLKGTHNVFYHDSNSLIVDVLKTLSDSSGNYWVERCDVDFGVNPYSEVPNRRAGRNKRAGLEKNATLLAYSLSKSINE